MKKVFIYCLLILIILMSVSAVNFVPQGDIVGMNRYQIINFTNLTLNNATICFNGDCKTSWPSGNGSSGNGTVIINSFNQVLNTTSNVTFNKVTSTNGFSGTLNWSFLLNIPSYVKDWTSDLASKLDASDQRYNETSKINNVNSSVQALITSNTTTNSRIDNINSSMLTNNSNANLSSLTVVNNVSATNFLGFINWSYLQNTPSYVKNYSPDINNVNTTTQALVTSNTTTNSRIDNVNSSVQALITSNTTTNTRIDSVNTTATNANTNATLMMSYNSTIARTGTCSGGQVVQNTTTSGVQCFTPAGSTYTAGNGIVLTGTQFNTSATTCSGTSNVSYWNGTSWNCAALTASGDGNNYTTALSLNNTGAVWQINLARNGMINLTATQDLSGLNSTALATTANNTANGKASPGSCTGTNAVQTTTTSGVTCYDTATTANTKAAPGNCAAGYVVQNTTTSGVQCVLASTGTGSGNVSGSGTANYLAKFSNNQNITTSNIIDNGSLVNITSDVSFGSGSNYIQFTTDGTNGIINTSYPLVNITSNLTATNFLGFINWSWVQNSPSYLSNNTVANFSSLTVNNINVCLSNGTNCIAVANGTNGVSVSSAIVLANGSLNVTLSNGTTFISGNLTGPTGPAGNNGTNGLNGSNGTSFSVGNGYLYNNGSNVIFFNDTLNNATIKSVASIYNDTLAINNVNSTVQALVNSNTTTNSRIDSINSSYVKDVISGNSYIGRSISNQNITLTFSESTMNTTINNLISSSSRANYPNNWTNITGTNLSGSLSNLQVKDGIVMNFSESSSGFEYRFNITATQTINGIDIFEQYVGGNNHQVEFYVYNYNTSNWQLLITWSNQASFTDNMFSLPIDSWYRQNNITQIRILHNTPAITSHYFMIDYLATTYNTGATGGSIAGGGSSGYIPIFTSTSAISNSAINQTSTDINIISRNLSFTTGYGTNASNILNAPWLSSYTESDPIYIAQNSTIARTGSTTACSAGNHVANITLGTNGPVATCTADTGGTATGNVSGSGATGALAYFVNSQNITGDVSKIYYNSTTGFLGINQNNPQYALDVYTTSTEIIQATSNNNGYGEISVENINNGSNASSDFVATASGGNETNGYIDMGMNGWNYTTGMGVAGGGPWDGYLYTMGNGSFMSNLLLGTYNSGNVSIFTNNREVLHITSAGLFGVNQPNPTYTIDINGTLKVNSTNTSVNTIFYYAGNSPTYVQGKVQNTNKQGSSDIEASSDIGDDSNYMIDIGVTGSNYSDPSYAFTPANTSYIIAANTSLYILENSVNQNKSIQFMFGNTTAPTTVMNITSNGLTVFGIINATNNLSTPKVCLNGDCRTVWPNLTTTNASVNLSLVYSNSSITGANPVSLKLSCASAGQVIVSGGCYSNVTDAGGLLYASYAINSTSWYCGWSGSISSVKNWIQIYCMNPNVPVNVSTNGISGAGTSGYHPLFNGASSLTNSVVYQNGTGTGINTTAVYQALDVAGNINTGWVDNQWIGESYQDASNYRMGLSFLAGNRTSRVDSLSSDGQGTIQFRVGTVASPVTAMSIGNTSNPVVIVNTGLNVSGYIQIPTNKSTTLAAGMMYYNTTLNTPCWYNGTAWRMANLTLC